MKNRSLTILAILICFLFVQLPILLHAQVTIGSAEPPLAGALLDLTESSRSNVITSTKGLLLPRVELSDLRILKMSDAAAIPNEEWLNYVGLTVYNVKEDFCVSTPLLKGLYIWDGTMWTVLGIQSGSASKVREYIDQEGNIFTARLFGGAGIWMTQNMSAKTFANSGNPIILYNGDSNSVPQYAYPSDDMDGWNVPPAEPNKNGLLYNWPAAANSYNPGLDVNQGQTDQGDTPGSNELEVMEETSAGAADGKIQGICPNGWHLPSDREWNQLERELYNNPEEYSRYVAADLPMDPTNPTWNPTWNTVPNSRGSATAKGHGIVMRDQCQIPGSTASLTAIEGGFAARYGGLVTGGMAIGLGINGYYWTASTFNLTSSWYRYISATDVKVNKVHTSDSNIFSVRCKKDVAN